MASASFSPPVVVVSVGTVAGAAAEESGLFFELHLDFLLGPELLKRFALEKMERLGAEAGVSQSGIVWFVAIDELYVLG